METPLTIRPISKNTDNYNFWNSLVAKHLSKINVNAVNFLDSIAPNISAFIGLFEFYMVAMPNAMTVANMKFKLDTLKAEYLEKQGGDGNNKPLTDKLIASWRAFIGESEEIHKPA